MIHCSKLRAGRHWRPARMENYPSHQIRIPHQRRGHLPLASLYRDHHRTARLLVLLRCQGFICFSLPFPRELLMHSSIAETPVAVYQLKLELPAANGCERMNQVTKQYILRRCQTRRQSKAGRHPASAARRGRSVPLQHDRQADSNSSLPID